jgi:hypothetical protein
MALPKSQQKTENYSLVSQGRFRSYAGCSAVGNGTVNHELETKQGDAANTTPWRQGGKSRMTSVTIPDLG